MATIEIGRDEVIVRLDGWEQVWSLRRQIRIRRDRVTVLRAAPTLAGAKPRGLRLPGSYLPFWPGPLVAGSYWLGAGRWEFWDLVRPMPDRVVEITVDRGPGSDRYQRLVVQAEDAAEVAALWAASA